MLAVVPVARVVAFNSWLKTNIDPGGGDWLTPSLSATGTAPATFAWFSAALTPAQLKLLMIRLCALSGIVQPAGRDGWTRQQRKQWLLDQRAAIRTATGIWVAPQDNDGQWDNPQDALTFLGLQAIRPATP